MIYESKQGQTMRESIAAAIASGSDKLLHNGNVVAIRVTAVQLAQLTDKDGNTISAIDVAKIAAEAGEVTLDLDD